MEGFMYRYHPRTERAIELADEELEDVCSATAAFKFPLFGAPTTFASRPNWPAAV